MEAPRLKIHLLDPTCKPTRAHDDDAGLDLYAATDAFLEPGERTLVPTGIAVAIPFGYAGLVCPRSGLSHKVGLSIVNSPGVVDSGYTGEVHVNLINHSTTAVHVNAGTRIAQLLLTPVAYPWLLEVDHLDDTPRGANGHGSTGA